MKDTERISLNNSRRYHKQSKDWLSNILPLLAILSTERRTWAVGEGEKQCLNQFSYILQCLHRGRKNKVTVLLKMGNIHASM